MEHISTASEGMKAIDGMKGFDASSNHTIGEFRLYTGVSSSSSLEFRNESCHSVEHTMASSVQVSLVADHSHTLFIDIFQKSLHFPSR